MNKKKPLDLEFSHQQEEFANEMQMFINKFNYINAVVNIMAMLLVDVDIVTEDEFVEMINAEFAKLNGIESTEQPTIETDSEKKEVKELSEEDIYYLNLVLNSPIKGNC